jgi:polar amino acid transport system substrate-binding protein
MSNPVKTEIALMARPFKLFRLLPFLFLLSISPASADDLDDVLERGKLRVGLSEFAPWTIKTRSGSLIGFEVDLAKKLAEDMGVNLELRLYPWDMFFTDTATTEIYTIAGGMAITPQRALQVNFTIPIATSGVGIVTNTEETADIQTLVDMNNANIIIAAVEETLSAGVAQRLFPDANVRVYAESDDAKRAVVGGRAHAFVTSMPEARFLALQNPDTLDLPLGEPLIASKEGLAVRKGEQELLNFLNAWVTAHDADEWLSSTHSYWFETIDWLDQVDGE